MFADKNIGVVSETISGGRAIDEDVFSSIAVLAERLRRIQKLGALFAGVEFSPDVAEIAACEMTSSIS